MEKSLKWIAAKIFIDPRTGQVTIVRILIFSLVLFILFAVALVKPSTGKVVTLDPTSSVDNRKLEVKQPLFPTYTATLDSSPTDEPTTTNTCTVTPTIILTASNTAAVFTLVPSSTIKPQIIFTQTLPPTQPPIPTQPPATLAPVPTQPPPPTTAPIIPTQPSVACCKHCGATSKPCGDSCISNSYKCSKPPGCACT